MSEEVLYSEVFHSIQGEGEYTGVPTAWVRFFLCNLQCNGFGQPDPTNPDTYDLPYENLIVSDYKSMEDLPVFERGCDSSYSWSKKFKPLQHKGTPADIAQKIRESMKTESNPQGLFAFNEAHQHLCFTGGEPLMKHAQAASTSILQEFIDQGDSPASVTYETNGTRQLTEEFKEYWSWTNNQTDSIELFMSVSPKLWTVAGEQRKKAIKPEVVAEYNNLTPCGQLKFVLGPEERQWDEMEEVVDLFRQAGVMYPVWIMPVGATVEGQKLVDGDVATMALKRGYNVSARVHTYLWGNVIGV